MTEKKNSPVQLPQMLASENHSKADAAINVGMH
jgi:hypothetical protein